MSSESTTAPNQELPGVSVWGSLMAWLRSLSLLEKLLCLATVVAVGGFAVVVFVPALMDFPKPTSLTGSTDFPLKGEHVEVLAAEAFWRESGEDAVSSEMAALPVLQLSLKGNGVVRVLFRDQDGRAVGDPVTIPVSGQTQVPAVGTTGLATRGDYAAYRLEEIEPWTVELLESPGGSEDPGDFARLMQMEISDTLK